jgi:hypothetical protein
MTHFGRVFKQLEKVPPSEFRRRLRVDGPRPEDRDDSRSMGPKESAGVRSWDHEEKPGGTAAGRHDGTELPPATASSPPPGDETYPPSGGDELGPAAHDL